MHNCSNMCRNAHPRTYKKQFREQLCFTVQKAGFLSRIPSTPEKSGGIQGLVDELIKHLGVAAGAFRSRWWMGYPPVTVYITGGKITFFTG